MARFFAEVQGQAGIATRIGSARSGIRSHTRGWNLGIAVYGTVDVEGNDCFGISASRGSHNPSDRILIGTVTLDDDGTPAMVVDSYYRIRQIEETYNA
jgi:hypothetical protein